jgi:hypothetical protein
MMFYLDSQNLTVLDYSLLTNPVFDVKSGVIIPMRGEVYDHEKRSACPIEAQHMNEIDNAYNVRIYIADSLLKCTLQAFQESKILKQKAQSLIRQYLNLDDRIGFGLDFPLASDGSLVEGDLLLALRAEVYFDQHLGLDARFITIPINVSTAAQLWVDTQHGEDIVKGHVNETSIALNVSVGS